MNRKTTAVLMRIALNTPSEEDIARAQAEEAYRQQMEAEQAALERQRATLSASRSLDPEEQEYQRQPVRKGYTVGRNDLCPCGSGRKFKQCHGRHS